MRGKWTEGEWSVERNTAGTWEVVAGEPDTYAPTIAQAWSGLGKFDPEANAHLIAAAPALYEALEAARPAVEVSATEEARGIRRDKGLGLSPRPARWRGVLADIDAALAQAHPPKGEGP